MDSVTDICKYHFLCFVIIMQVINPGDPIYNEMGPFYFTWTVFQQ